ncbi:aminoglycoside phosphotransferase family protein [Streptomyces sp. NBC_00638]|uniref:phosphotransferase family protein n=1 Tax=unclassified Streptomyces TaxID=2593676 RepID=UPI002259ED7D|nr:aminoglycoside phosphotransferase family protein [Streptomyces sp. NBC_00638]MCX5008864.1 aminoglycoside phosphotransferase family protein [Streptomyces sp. NBC_00638]
MAEDENAAVVEAECDDLGWSSTRRWVERNLPPGDRIRAAEGLRGGWTSQMRRLDIEGDREPYSLALRSFVKPFFVKHAPGLLAREADILRLLADTAVPTARLLGVDATTEHCDHPSLLMSLLPGSVRLGDEDIERKSALLARQLLAIHEVYVPEGTRPRTYEAWTSPERVRLPGGSRRPEVWQRAVEVIRRPPPGHRPCFLHRDFHPGNVLFAGEGAGLTITGVVDWVETSWGPADLDVAHCSTNLALLHGAPVGMRFADHYIAAGGTLSGDPADHLYWRLLDALAFAPNAEKVGEPWRELGREDLTSAVLAQRLEEYLQALFSRYG